MRYVTAYIGIGSNLGDRHAHIRHALEHLAALTDAQPLRAAGIIETEPVGPVEQGLFLNTVAELSTALQPAELLAELHRIERERGRDRSRQRRWGPRTLDLDILLFGDAIIREPGLVIPHKHLHERDFVLRSLVELAPELTVPGTGHTVQWLLDNISDAPTGDHV